MEGTIGEIRLFGGNFAPRSWAFCNGQLISINQNQALFSILGTTYGGDGRTTFALPDLRGRTAIGEGHGAGLSTRPLGQRSGQETVTLTSLQIPSHTHFATVNAGTAVIAGTATAVVNVSADSESEEPADLFIGKSDGVNSYGPPDGMQTLSRDAVTIDTSGLSVNMAGMTVTNGMTGGSQAHNNMQPYLVLHYIICMFGTFPSRN